MKSIFTITHNRPDRKRPVTRKLSANNVRVYSDSQLVGFVAHSVFTDAERGPNGSTYVVREEREDGTTRVVAVNKRNGHYIS